MFRFHSMISAVMLTSGLLGCAGIATACPFCSSVSQTFTEEFTASDVVVIANLTDVPELPEEDVDPGAELPKAKFVVKTIIKGDEYVKVGSEIEVLYFGEGKKDAPYLLTGADPPNIMWTTPLVLSERAHKYVTQVLSLPEDASRLEFFQEYLEDEDEMLARDAYDEFAKTPYDGVIALKDKMHHDKLIEFIKSPTVPASRRRLYFTMLGVCGTEADAPLLHEMLTSSDRKTKAGMDAMLACYLLLTGEEGLEEVERLFLKNKEADYPDTYAAIMAIRFHGNEVDKLDKQRLIVALRHLLDRPDLADLVIRDLARWEDWEVMPRLVTLFKEADEKSSWVRVPVINYLRSCPLPEAKAHIEELKKIDADAVKRAQTFYPDTTEDEGGEVTPDGSEAEASPGDASLYIPPAAQPQPVQPQPQPIQPRPLGTQPAAQLASQPQPLPLARTASESSLAGTADFAIASGSDLGADAVSLASSTSASSTSGSVSTPGPAAMTLPTQTNSAAELVSANRTPEPSTDSNTHDDLHSSSEAQVAGVPNWQPNRAMLWGVPLASGIVLLYVLRLVLGVPYTVRA